MCAELHKSGLCSVGIEDFTVFCFFRRLISKRVTLSVINAAFGNFRYLNEVFFGHLCYF